MTYSSNAGSNANVSEALWSSLAMAAQQASDDEQQENNRVSKRQRDDYEHSRTLSHARSKASAKKEALTKSTNVAQTRHTNALKDDKLLSSSKEDGSLPLLTKGQSSTPSKPKMPAPQSPFSNSPPSPDKSSEEVPNIMAIIARVMIMVANVQQKGWQTFWQMGNDNINASLEQSMAESKATEDQYENQSMATQTQADQMGKDGIMQISSFALSAAAGMTSAAEGEEVDDAERNVRNLTDDEQAAPAADAQAARGPNLNEAEQQPQQAAQQPEGERAAGQDRANGNADRANANQEANQNQQVREGDRNGANAQRQADLQANERPKSRWERFNNWRTGNNKMAEFKDWAGETLEDGKDFVSDKYNFAKKMTNRILGNGWKYSQMINPGMQGIQMLQFDKPLLSQKAAYEGAQGQAAARATIARGYSEYNNQIFNRTEDVRQGSSQNVDYAMNVYKSASEAVTQAVSSMAR